MAKMYKITAYDEDGAEISLYTTEENRRSTIKMLTEEYGNFEQKEVDSSEISEDE